MKKVVICLIKHYQKTAPQKLRESCRFVPSCSNYMIIAIDKYGLLKGVILGFKRIYRCKAPNGGIDYP